MRRVVGRLYSQEGRRSPIIVRFEFSDGKPEGVAMVTTRGSKLVSFPEIPRRDYFSRLFCGTVLILISGRYTDGQNKDETF